MPNIIEQQDLLKGLPDDRLAMMMQNPTGDIPPFLVAAEAQRRQAIREQFSGGPQESVVDTLTKQLSGSVPQNIQGGPQQPPQMPPPMMPPQMAGVAALPQGMRRGGYVQRYQDGSLVQPSFRGRAGAGGYLPGEVPEESMFSRVYDYVGSAAAPFFSNVQKFGFNPTVEQLAQIKAETEAAGEKEEPYKYGMTRDERVIMQPAPVRTPLASEDPGKLDTSLENQMKGVSAEERSRKLREIYGVSAEDSAYVRQQLEELYGGNEPSSWEKAQKWFAASQAAIEPGQNNWQATINALSALGAGMAGERASERENKQALAEALLKLEIGDRDERREAAREIAKAELLYQMQDEEDARSRAAAARQEQLDAYKLYAMEGGKGIDKASEQIASLEKQKNDYIKLVTEQSQNMGQTPDFSKDPTVIAYNEEISRLRGLQYQAEGSRQKALSDYAQMTGTSSPFSIYEPGRLTPSR